MSDEKKKVYLLVECEVADAGMVNGCDAITRAARTLNDVVFDGSERRTESGKIAFNIYGEVAIGHPSIMPDDVMRVIEWRRKTMRRVEKEFGGILHELWDAPIHEKLKQAVIEENERPSREQFQALVDRGVINHKGEVLLRGPWDDE
jgi:hypothetical protein